jgi:hypothetical protein
MDLVEWEIVERKIREIVREEINQSNQMNQALFTSNVDKFDNFPEERKEEVSPEVEPSEPTEETEKPMSMYEKHLKEYARKEAERKAAIAEVDRKYSSGARVSKQEMDKMQSMDNIALLSKANHIKKEVNPDEEWKQIEQEFSER